MNNYTLIKIDRYFSLGVLLIVACAGHVFNRDASAATMQYTTDAGVNLSNGVSPPVAGTNLDPPLQYQKVEAGSFDPSLPFSLGQFVVSKEVSSNVTFDNVPFFISFNIPSLSRFEINPNPPGTPGGYPEGKQYNAAFTVAGHLNGDISSGLPHLVASVDRIDPISLNPRIPEVLYLSSLPFSVDQLLIPKSFAIDSAGTDGQTSPIMVQVVPEPTPVVLFLLAMVGYVNQSRRRRRA